MAANFKIKTLRKGQTLYLIPRGDFDGSSASELKKLITKEWKKGMEERKKNKLTEIRLNTTKLRNIEPFGFDVWSNSLLHCIDWPPDLNLTFSKKSKKLKKK